MEARCTKYNVHHFRDATTKSCVDQALVDLKSLNDLALSGQI